MQDDCNNDDAAPVYTPAQSMHDDAVDDDEVMSSRCGSVAK